MDAFIETGGVQLETRLAQAHSKFYPELITTLLSPQSSQDKRAHINELITVLPGTTMKNVYASGVEKLENRFAVNKKLLEESGAATDGEKIRFLFDKHNFGYTENQYISKERAEEIKREFLDQFPYQDITFSEPTEGLFILEADGEALYRLRGKRLLFGEGIYYRSARPGFIIVPKQPLETSKFSKEQFLIHELHHVLHKELEEAGFITKLKDMDEKVWEAFNAFSDEMAAYLLIDENLSNFPLKQFLWLADTEKKRQHIKFSRDKILLAMEIAKNAGRDQSLFIYPAQKARSFEELEKEVELLTPSFASATPELTQLVYTLSHQLYTDVNGLVAYLKSYGCVITPEIATVFTEQSLKSKPYSSLNERFTEINTINNFLTQIKALPEEGRFLENLQETLALPTETLQAIEQIYKKDKDDPFLHSLPVSASSTEEFLMKFFSINPLWHLDTQDQTGLKTLITSSPQIREALAKSKDEILKKSQEEWSKLGRRRKKDYGYSFHRNRAFLQDILTSKD